jgi:hypothetical protein
MAADHHIAQYETTCAHTAGSAKRIGVTQRHGETEAGLPSVSLLLRVRILFSAIRIRAGSVPWSRPSNTGKRDPWVARNGMTLLVRRVRYGRLTRTRGCDPRAWRFTSGASRQLHRSQDRRTSLRSVDCLLGNYHTGFSCHPSGVVHHRQPLSEQVISANHPLNPLLSTV